MAFAPPVYSGNAVDAVGRPVVTLEGGVEVVNGSPTGDENDMGAKAEVEVNARMEVEIEVVVSPFVSVRVEVEVEIEVEIEAEAMFLVVGEEVVISVNVLIGTTSREVEVVPPTMVDVARIVLRIVSIPPAPPHSSLLQLLSQQNGSPFVPTPPQYWPGGQPALPPGAGQHVSVKKIQARSFPQNFPRSAGQTRVCRANKRALSAAMTDAARRFKRTIALDMLGSRRLVGLGTSVLRRIAALRDQLTQRIYTPARLRSPAYQKFYVASKATNNSVEPGDAKAGYSPMSLLETWRSLRHRSAPMWSRKRHTKTEAQPLQNKHQTFTQLLNLAPKAVVALVSRSSQQGRLDVHTRTAPVQIYARPFLRTR